MKTRAAVAWKAGEPLSIETIDIEGPKAGEVLVEIKATGICHTDAYTLSGADPEGIFPAILGHEGAGIVREVGAGVTTLKPGDHVIPLYTPECRQCKTCLSRRSNLCTAIRATQGKGVMPDGTSRFRCDGDNVFHYMGCSTFANFTVLPEIALAKVREDAPFDKICYIGCGVTTGIGAVINTAKVWPGANVAVFGLGGIGLNVVQGRTHRRRRQDHRHRSQSGTPSDGRKIRHDAFHQSRRGRPRQGGAGGRRSDRRRRGLLLRMHRQRECHAPGAGMLPPRLGREHHHRRRRFRPGNRDAAVSAGDRPGLERHGLRRRPRPHRRARRSSTGTWTARSISTT